MIPIAFDEAVRWESPVQTFFRTATTDVRVGEHVVQRAGHPDGGVLAQHAPGPFHVQVAQVAQHDGGALRGRQRGERVAQLGEPDVEQRLRNVLREWQ
mgnify:CR=1 FL=1